MQAIQDDVHWLGFAWASLRHASDYFEVYYLAAEKLIRQGDAFVCDLTAEQVREYRGSLTESGRNSPWRDRGVDENLDLFRRMRAGEFADGARTLRAKIDMASGNITCAIGAVPDQALRSIAGAGWCIYPMYDFAHSLGDAVEGITHSLCTLEFEDHRPLYDWCVAKVDLANSPELLAPLLAKGLPNEAGKPRQIEFSRLNINYTVMSKRKLVALVNDGLVDGWDDPRMPTLQGLRRRGYTPGACGCRRSCGISKQNSMIDFSVLEGALREDLDAHAPRGWRCSIREVVLTNLADITSKRWRFRIIRRTPRWAHAKYRSRARCGSSARTRRNTAERLETAGAGGEVRLRSAGIVRCDEVVKDDAGDIIELRGTLDPESRPGMVGAERKIKGTIHWVSAAHAVAAESACTTACSR